MRHVHSDLFHEDGCVRANIRTQVYMVVLKPKCDHTKVRGGILMVRAESAAAVRQWVRQYLRIPQTEIEEVSRLCKPHPDGRALPAAVRESQES